MPQTPFVFDYSMLSLIVTVARPHVRRKRRPSAAVDKPALESTRRGSCSKDLQILPDMRGHLCSAFHNRAQRAMLVYPVHTSATGDRVAVKFIL